MLLLTFYRNLLMTVMTCAFALVLVPSFCVLLWCHHHDLYNIQVHVAIFIDYGFCIITFVTKLSTEGHSFGCIRPMVNFQILGHLLHRTQC